MLRWIGHVLRHDGLLHEIIEGRMKGKPRRGRRRIEMLHDLANDGDSVALKRAAEDRDGWRHRKDVKNRLYCRRLLMMTGRYPNRHYSAVVLRPMINFAHDDRDSLITIMHL